MSPLRSLTTPFPSLETFPYLVISSFNYNDMVECHLKKDPHAALLVMHMGLGNLLKSH
jgi:hypothetical protein